MNLVHADQMIRRDLHRVGDAGAVDLYDLALIRTANAAVQPRKHTRRRAPATGEESVAHIAQTIGGEYFQRHGSNPGGGF